MKCDLATCEERDPKGLYKKARNGEIPFFTGIDSPYEEPETPELVLDTGAHDREECKNQLVQYVKDQTKKMRVNRKVRRMHFLFHKEAVWFL